MHQGEPVNSGIPLHAPIPVSGYSTLLASNTGDTQALAFSPHGYPAPVEETKPHIGEQTNPLDVYLHAPQVLFPTPSELLTDLNAREREARDGSEAAGKGAPKPTARSPTTPRSKTDVEEPENLNQRKQYFRSVSDNVGFSITDPDTITSHDKKRCYLECLEEYVQWMHDQLRLVGQEPIQVERVSSYRGLKSRSIRTMLVRKQEDIGKLNQHKKQEEQKFMQLQNELVMRQMAEDPQLQPRRQSIAMGAVPNTVHGFSRDG
ncbi:uncharacterized protein TRAVEDRAFT_158646 [Trametes versicolor FP-101664 SS1]|uniref:uncharacterized protein n=1 Tax=Trametes versicolor (strain FP-101664) TaxID=717944 RepID=UPI0004622757|nr:uncharacterized protein TRAVEDRAFT_158646 [Trametes versicolor FP-101664 SS1]EIW64413.1 hypothetical protein TRAVEDRAFT_158646 [Trametes versicolor FP-101664 SS1]